MRTPWIIACLWAAPLFGQATVKEVERAEQAWSAAVRSADVAALEKMLVDDLVYTHATGPVDSKRVYIDSLKSGVRKYIGADFTGTKIRVYGNTAVVNTDARMRGVAAGKPFDDRVRLMHVWVKSAAGWQLVAHQTTKIP